MPSSLLPHGLWPRLLCPQDSQGKNTGVGCHALLQGVFLTQGWNLCLCNMGDLGLIPGLGRSPGEGKGYPLQYSGLENSMNCIVHGVTKSWTGLSDFDLLSLPLGFPCSSSGKESACNAEDLGSIPRSGRSPGEGNGNPVTAFLPGEFHGQRSLVGYSPWGLPRVWRGLTLPCSLFFTTSATQ